MRFRLPIFLAALWWGSLTALGFFVVPMLFAWLPAPALAGNMAARLFTGQTWISLACGLLLLVLFSRRQHAGAQAGPGHPAIAFIMAGLLLALLAEFAVAPRIVARENLRLWHSVGSGMALAQWLCAAVTLWRSAAPSQDASAPPPMPPAG